MIAAKPGLEAVYLIDAAEHEKKKFSVARKGFVGGHEIDIPAGKKVGAGKAIVAWNDDGDPLVVGRMGLELASSWSNYLGINEAASDDVVEFHADSSWLLWRTDDDGRPWSSRLCGWGRTANGDIVALELDSAGWVMTHETTDPAEFRHESEGPPEKPTPEAIRYIDKATGA